MALIAPVSSRWPKIFSNFGIGGIGLLMVARLFGEFTLDQSGASEIVGHYLNFPPVVGAALLFSSYVMGEIMSELGSFFFRIASGPFGAVNIEDLVAIIGEEVSDELTKMFAYDLLEKIQLFSGLAFLACLNSIWHLVDLLNGWQNSVGLGFGISIVAMVFFGRFASAAHLRTISLILSNRAVREGRDPLKRAKDE